MFITLKEFNMNKIQWEDLIKRAAWTALQGFLGAFLTLAPGILNAPNLNQAKALTVAAIVAGIAAALSAVKTFVLTYRK